MSKTDLNQASIMIASDNITDASLVKKQVQDAFGNIQISVDPDKANADFERHRPEVLILAFNTLEKAERYYLGLYRLCALVQQHPHRTVILCSKDDVKRVYELCNKNYFDDYVLFWPMTHDPSRLAISIHHAIRELAMHHDNGPSVTEFAAQARRLAELEGLLNQKLSDGGQRIAAANRAILHAEQEIGVGLDKFSHHFSNKLLPDALSDNHIDVLREEIGRLKKEVVQERFREVAVASAPLKEWTDGFKEACKPHIESTRTLSALADRIQPKVLVVDDDELQNKIAVSVLKAEGFQALSAYSGVEALNFLRKARPDLILMDFQMPNMNGIETIRQLKAVPQLMDIPVIMLTGKSEKTIVADCIKAGACGFLVKPYDRAVFISRIKQALSSTIAPN